MAVECNLIELIGNSVYVKKHENEASRADRCKSYHCYLKMETVFAAFSKAWMDVGSGSGPESDVCHTHM